MSETVKFEDILTRYGKLIYPNKGVSMKPLLRQGRDLMVIERKGPEPCKKYDAVLFRRPSVRGPDDYVLHRILRINKDGSYWIVGDNCCTGETVREAQILGVLSAVVRGGRQIPVTAPGYRLYVTLWCKPWPLRFAVLRVWHLCRRVLSRLKRAIKKAGVT